MKKYLLLMLVIANSSVFAAETLTKKWYQHRAVDTTKKVVLGGALIGAACLMVKCTEMNLGKASTNMEKAGAVFTGLCVLSYLKDMYCAL